MALYRFNITRLYRKKGAPVSTGVGRKALLMKTVDVQFLRLAIRLAEEAREAGEDPFGAVLVCDKTVIYQGRDRCIENSDPTAHAEMSVIREYCQQARVFSLESCTLYTSTEPCPMCAGAIHWARIARVVFSVSQASLQTMSGGKPKPSAESIINMGRKNVEVTGPMLEDDGLAVFEGYEWQPTALRPAAHGNDR